MRISPSALATVVALLLIKSSYASINCFPSGIYHDGYCYSLNTNPKTWADARDDCLNNWPFGDLVVIENPNGDTINNILYTLVQLADMTADFEGWIGLHVVGGPLHFQWVDNDDLLPADYEKFPGPIPPAVVNHCGTFATPAVVPIAGQWQEKVCTEVKPYFCRVNPLDLATDCDWNDAYLKETNKCYCLIQEEKTWFDAKQTCENGNGALAKVSSINVNNVLVGLIPDPSNHWYSWIGASNDNAANQWDWTSDNSLVSSGFIYFEDLMIPPGFDACAVMTNRPLEVPTPGQWKSVDCVLNTNWFFCERVFPFSACCDPHFMVRPRGMAEPVCFDYYGSNKDIIQLIYSDKYDLAVNAEVFSHEHTKKTWFGALSLIVFGCEFVADMEGISVNGEAVPWKNTGEQHCGRSGLVYSIKDDLHRPSTHLIIHVMPGLELVFSKDQKTYKFGTVEYMDFDITQYYKLDETTDGILGEFLGMTVSLDKDSVGNNTDSAILYFPEEPGRGSVIAHKVSRKNLLTSEHFHCWNVEDEGAGLVRGSASDYLVPDLLTSQRAQSLNKMKEEEDADAIF